MTSCGAALLSTAAPKPSQTAVAHYCAHPNPIGATISNVGGMGSGNADSTAETVFVFPGQGSQWAEKAVELLRSAPAFAEQMRLCDAALAEFVDWSLLEVVRGSVGLYESVISSNSATGATGGLYQSSIGSQTVTIVNRAEGPPRDELGRSHDVAPCVDPAGGSSRPTAPAWVSP